MPKYSSRAPVRSLDAALAAGEARYIHEEGQCPRCRAPKPLLYVDYADACVVCLAMDFREELGKTHPTAYRACLAAGLDYWVDGLPRMCPRGPHGLRHDLGTGRCVECERRRREERAERHTTGSGRPDGRFRNTPAPCMERDAARALGFVRYTGPSCRRGHEGVRYVSTGNCIACLRGQP